MQNLAIGSSGQAVMDLQKMLNANGFQLAVDGKFGPLTQNALKSYQGSHNLVPDGIYGPKTAAVLSPQPTKPAPTPVKQTVPQAPPPVGTQFAMAAAGTNAVQQAATLGTPPNSFADALDAAQKNPDIISKYADMAKLDKQSFTQQIQAAQTQYGTQAEQYRRQFENERKMLSEQQAASGTAYSGFRGKAQQDLSKTEAGIVTSSRSQQQQALNQLTSQFESKYGTGATPQASLTLQNPLLGGVSASGLKQNVGGADVLGGQLAGGITGTFEPTKRADIATEASNIYQSNPALGTLTQ